MTPPPVLTLDRDTMCTRCGYPMIVEWTSLGSHTGPRHVYCSGPGDALDVLRAFDQLSEDDQAHLLALIDESGKS